MSLLKNYKAVVSYDGGRYRGYQSQTKEENTIQGKLESVLSKMCGEKVDVAGSGRTDAGVHAKGQVISFALKSTMHTTEMRDYCNHYLPEDIVILSVEEAAKRFHARLSAEEKIYSYHIVNGDIPPLFQRKYVTYIKEPLDLIAMEKMAKALSGTHDYQAFSSAKKSNKSTIKTVHITVERKEDEIEMVFRGDGFLYHMVRILTGTILEAGMGKRTLSGTDAIFTAKDRSKAGYLVPPEGLFLDKVIYD
ncbi:MAG TPA: tRNA pseudouridine(38-40) synthase TruA [Lachnospiraceae bacterium]|nr:tRNA pseudouridine(38-40) synthase TruA [Lachnospiraceae bacterium]HPF30037.1 tRNA pseudouridine(38-40) synthase TruA [Lachnospiraceae bacterium]